MNKTKNKILSFLLVAVLLIPVIVLADEEADTVDKVQTTIKNITRWVTTISTGVAILMYTIGGFLWMSDAGNAERRNRMSHPRVLAGHHGDLVTQRHLVDQTLNTSFLIGRPSFPHRERKSEQEEQKEPGGNRSHAAMIGRRTERGKPRNTRIGDWESKCD